MLKQIQFTQQNLEKLKQIEATAYENTPYKQMQGRNSWNSIADYCEGSLNNLHIYMEDSWYLILAEQEDYIELVDLASTQRHTPLFKVMEILYQYKKPFTMDCRENTSYRMLQALEKAGRIEITSDDAYDWGGEVFHDIEASFTQKMALAR